jgi:hypothetical protein
MKNKIKIFTGILWLTKYLIIFFTFR